jgi:hypothetical protein
MDGKGHNDHRNVFIHVWMLFYVECAKNDQKQPAQILIPM